MTLCATVAITSPVYRVRPCVHTHAPHALANVAVRIQPGRRGDRCQDRDARQARAVHAGLERGFEGCCPDREGCHHCEFQIGEHDGAIARIHGWMPYLAIRRVGKAVRRMGHRKVVCVCTPRSMRGMKSRGAGNRIVLLRLHCFFCTTGDC